MKTTSPSEVWLYQLPKIIRLCHVTDKNYLPAIWWDLNTCKRDMRHFYLKAEVEATIAQFHLTTPEVLHLLLLKLMGLELTQNIGGPPMSGLYMFHFTFLSDYDSPVALSCNTFHEGASTHPIHARHLRVLPRQWLTPDQRMG